MESAEQKGFLFSSLPSATVDCSSAFDLCLDSVDEPERGTPTWMSNLRDIKTENAVVNWTSDLRDWTTGWNAIAILQEDSGGSIGAKPRPRSASSSLFDPVLFDVHLTMGLFYLLLC